MLRYLLSHLLPLPFPTSSQHPVLIQDNREQQLIYLEAKMAKEKKKRPEGG
jgi:hypothetical protein